MHTRLTLSAITGLVALSSLVTAIWAPVPALAVRPAINDFAGATMMAPLPAQLTEEISRNAGERTQPVPLPSQTDICGAIGDTNWAMAGSPYLITCASSLSGHSLTVDAGVTVRFVPGTYLDLYAPLAVNGASGDVVTFTSSQPVPARGDWGGLRFHAGAEGSSFTYAVVEYGSGISADAGPLTVQHSIIQFNNSSGIYVNNPNGSVITNNIVFSNTAYSGGGIFIHCGNATISGNSVTWNSATTRGGGVHAYGYCGSPSTFVTLTDNTIANNSLFSYGGAGVLYDSADGIIANNVIRDNEGTGADGGGISAGGASRPTVLVSGNIISGNKSDFDGAGISTDSLLTITANLIQGNVLKSGSDGAGIRFIYPFNLATPWALSCNTVINNIAPPGGVGGIWSSILSPIHNNTISNNSGYQFQNGSGAMVDATDNYWGTTDSNQIAAAITGPVSFVPYLNAPDPCAPLLATVPPESVAISGPTSGSVGAAQVFTATVSPISTTTPITYAWQATGQAPLTHTTGSLLDTAAFNWPTPGAQSITLTVNNVSGTISAVYSMTTAIVAPSSLAISGPASGLLNASNPYAATVTPLTATLPMTYVWQATDQLPLTHTLTSILDVATFAWSMTGSHSVTVTAQNAGGVVSATYAVMINNPVPGLGSMSPLSAIVGSPAFTLSVTGTNLLPGSVVRWNGSDRPTTFVDANHLQASIASADLSSTGTVPVTVLNPAPGGGESNALSFIVKGVPPTFVVNSVVDAVDANSGDGTCASAQGKCTLRAAIMEANALATGVTILLPSGTYTLTIPGTNEDAGAAGDLDIRANVVISGTGGISPTINANRLDRILDVRAPATVVVSGVVFYNGFTPLNYGGAIYNTGSLVLNGSAVIGSSAYWSGGIENLGTLRLHNSVVSGNTTSAGEGGGIGNLGVLTLVHSTVSDNTSNSNAGGIYTTLSSTLVITSSVISGNHAGPLGTGGGITAYEASVVITDTLIQSNTADTGGGIFATAGTLLASNSVIAGNAAMQNGGGVGNSSSMTFHNVTFMNNDGDSDGNRIGSGGAIVNYNVLTMTNSTVSGNRAERGGGIENIGNVYFPVRVTLINSTVSANVAAGQGGGINNWDQISLRNSLVASNTASTGPDCAGAGVSSSGYNLIGNTADCTISGAIGDKTNLAAGLGPLQQKGSNLFTHPLLSGSPAIDGGNPAGCTDEFGNVLTTDERGVTRPQGARCDIGAYEARLGDLAVMESDSPDPVVVGHPLTYTLVLTYVGQLPAESVTLTETLPSDVVFGSAVPSQGSCVLSGSIVQCTLGTVASGSSITVMLVVMPAVPGTIQNAVAVDALISDTDMNLANNVAVETTTVDPDSYKLFLPLLNRGP